MAKKYRFKGFRNIYFAPIDQTTGEYQKPVRILGGKSISGDLKYELEEFESDDVIDDQEYYFAGGEGKLSLKSLLPEDYELLFGSTVDAGGVAVRSTDVAPAGALLFERQLRGAVGKRLYCVYNVKFAPTGFNAESSGQGAGETNDELTFAIGEGEDNLIIYTLDTNLASPEQITKSQTWYTEIQVPGVSTAETLLNMKMKNKDLE